MLYNTASTEIYILITIFNRTWTLNIKHLKYQYSMFDVCCKHTFKHIYNCSKCWPFYITVHFTGVRVIPINLYVTICLEVEIVRSRVYPLFSVQYLSFAPECCTMLKQVFADNFLPELSCKNVIDGWSSNPIADIEELPVIKCNTSANVTLISDCWPALESTTLQVMLLNPTFSR